MEFVSEIPNPDPVVAVSEAMGDVKIEDKTKDTTVDSTLENHEDCASESPAEKSDSVSETVTVFCCQRCRCILFTEDQLSKQHDAGQHRISYRKKMKDLSVSATSVVPAFGTTPSDKGPTCSCHFLSEPNEWMSKSTASQSVSGKLQCPACNARVGTFAWAGSQCNCGTWIVPALKFPINGVDPRTWRYDSLPNHVQDAVIESTFTEENSGEEVLTIQQKREKLHQEWIDRVNEGDESVYVEMLDPSENSLTTVQKKCFEGLKKVSTALAKSTERLKGKIKVVEGPAALPEPSTSSRLLFEVDDLEGILFGEVIVWSGSLDEPKAQHIIRIKNPSEMFMQGGR